MLWLEAPPQAVEARFRLGEREQTAPVNDQFALAVFDDVNVSPEGWPAEWPTLESWVTSDDPAP